jgi:dTDP-4-amino-4,6-dideoxygalactose transaminase
MKSSTHPANGAALAPIPLVDLKAQIASIRPELDAAIADVVTSGAFISGPLAKRFEDEYAAWLGSARVVACSSGTSALRLVLETLIEPGDAVVVPAMTFIATAEPVVLTGAEVVFADVDPATGCLDPAAAEAALTPQTRAIIGVDLHGRLADWGRFADLARQHDLELIRDAAQSHGARPGTEAQGASLFAEGGIDSLARAATHSFYPAKNLGAFGDAGAISTNDQELANFAERFADHGRTAKYEHLFLGDNCRMDGLQAAVLSVKLRHLADWNARRRALAERYHEMLANVGDLRLPPLDAGAGHVWHLFALRTSRRDDLFDHLQAEGIGAGMHYPIPLHMQPAFADHPQGRQGAFPVAETFAAETLSLPLYPEMTPSQQERVAESVRRFFGGA